MSRKLLPKFCLPTTNHNCVQMPNHRIVLLLLGVWTSTIPTGAILTESPLSPHVNPTSFPPLTKGVSGMSLSADHEIAGFAPSSPSSFETKKTDELGSTRYNGETNRSNKADYNKQQDSFFPPSLTSSSNNSEPPSFSSIMQATASTLPASATKPYQGLNFNRPFSATSTSKNVPFLSSAKISATAPLTSSSKAARGGESELISTYSLRSTSIPSSHPYISLSSDSTTTASLATREGSVEGLSTAESKPIAFPDKPPFYSSTPPSVYGYGSTEDGKQSNINLLRKLWASTRSGKLNLTDEHRSLLRIESKAGTPSIAKAVISPFSSSSPLPSPQATATFPPPLTEGREKTEQFQIQNQVTATNRPTSIPEISTRYSTSFARFDDFPVSGEIEVDGEMGKGNSKDGNGNFLQNSSAPISSSLSSETIKPTQGGAPLLSSFSPSTFDMTSLPFSQGESKPPSSEVDHVKESESNQQAPLLPVVVTTSNFLLPMSSPSLPPLSLHLGASSSDERRLTEKKDDGEEATVVTTKLAFPFVENIVGTSENVKENLIKLKESSSSVTSPARLSLPSDKDVGKAPPRHHLMLYPEWLSSGGVYPDDDTSSQAGSSGGLLPGSAYLGNGSSGNGGGGAEYYNEPEYEPLISGEGSTVAHISSHLYNFAVPNRNLPPPPPLPPLTEEEEIRDDEEFKRYTRLREKLADELLQDVVAAAGARRNWQNGRSGNIKEQVMVQEQPPGEEVEGIGERESRGFVGSSKLISSGGGDGGVVSTESPQAIIAQQSGLADVISRGRIDSVMYVYFGDKLNDYHTEEIAGRVIQAIGGVIAAVAQVLTVLGAAKCVRRNAPTYTLPVHLHIGFALLISNLLLLLAVHATEPIDICATVAMILHYLHLVIGCWLFAHTVQTYRELRRHVESPTSLGEEDAEEHHRFGELPRRSTRPNIVPYCFAAWSAPLPFILMSYLVNPDGYETRHYCWMSIEKGMVVSFIVPVFLLIGMNTLLVVLSLRHLLALRKLWHDSSGSPADVMDEHSLDEKLIGNGIRASAMLLPLLAVMWFLEVVALENATSIFFQVAAAVANIGLSWLVMYFLGNEIWPEMWCQFSKVSRANSLLSMDDPCGGSSVQPSAAHLSFDNEPLLGFANSSNTTTAANTTTTTSSSSRASSMMMMMPSTSKAATTSGTVTVTGPVSTSAAGPSSSTGTSFTAIAKKPLSGKYPYSTNKSKNLPIATPQSSSSCGLQQLQTMSSIAPILGGKKSNKGGGGGLLMKSKPNWSQPGGNEIYELKLDSISTICK